MRTRVLMPLYYYAPYTSGLTLYAKWIAEGLVREGYDVTVLASRHDRTLPKRETLCGVEVIREPVIARLGKGVIMPTFLWQMVRLARQSDYVNVHLPLAESGLAALLIPRRKTVTTYQCDINLGDDPVSRVVGAVSMALMKIQLWRSRAIVAITRDYFEHSKMRRFKHKLVAIYPPVRQPTARTDPGAVFRRAGVPDDSLKIGFVGRIVYEKGLQFLLEAVPLLERTLPDFRIVLTGDYSNIAGGSVKDELDLYIDRYPGRIVFTGYLNDADRDGFYEGLDVFVLPSIDPLEAFGIVQVEAMLGGSPVVASDLPGVRELVTKTGYGRVARAGDAEDLARQITEVVLHRESYGPDIDRIAAMFAPDVAVAEHMKLMPRRVDTGRAANEIAADQVTSAG